MNEAVKIIIKFLETSGLNQSVRKIKEELSNIMLLSLSYAEERNRNR